MLEIWKHVPLLYDEVETQLIQAFAMLKVWNRKGTLLILTSVNCSGTAAQYYYRFHGVHLVEHAAYF